jgi:hypothetical protein
MLLPAEGPRYDPPLRRHRFTRADEITHRVCHCLDRRAAKLEPSHCRATTIVHDVDRAIERGVSILVGELLMLVAQSLKAVPVAATAARLDVLPAAMGWRFFNPGLAAGSLS